MSCFCPTFRYHSQPIVLSQQKHCTMTIQRSDIESRTGPKYIAITEALADSIRRGDMKPGERLPTHRDLADTLGVTVDGKCAIRFGDEATFKIGKKMAKKIRKSIKN